MSRKWNDEQKLRQSVKVTRQWQKRVRENPNAHPVAKARVSRDLTQENLAELAGVHKSTLTEIECGREPGRFTRERLSIALAIPESELFQ
jgi:DNA-binding XRE family transcriptional regulator